MRLAALCLLVSALAAGCGGGQASDALSETARNLGKIHSGDLTLRLVVWDVEPAEARRQDQGPFDAGASRLPRASRAPIITPTSTWEPPSC